MFIVEIRPMVCTQKRVITEPQEVHLVCLRLDIEPTQQCLMQLLCSLTALCSSDSLLFIMKYSYKPSEEDSKNIHQFLFSFFFLAFFFLPSGTFQSNKMEVSLSTERYMQLKSFYCILPYSLTLDDRHFLQYELYGYHREIFNNIYEGNSIFSYWLI